MAIIADVPTVHPGDNQARALFTLSVLTGVVILAAGFLRLGSVLRYVSNTGMTGFISAVGVTIILGHSNRTAWASASDTWCRIPAWLKYPTRYSPSSAPPGQALRSAPPCRPFFGINGPIPGSDSQSNTQTPDPAERAAGLDSAKADHVTSLQ